MQPHPNNPATEYQAASATENEEDHELIGPNSWPDEEDTSQWETRTDEPPMMAIDPLPIHQFRPDAASVADEFQGACLTFGKGKTFLEDFTMDPYAAERKVNLYYPFALKEEWELASFLLLSGLSMASITKFLSLKLVRPFLLCQFCTIHHGTLRCRHFTSHSEPQRTCAQGLKCFQKAHNGSSNLGKLQNPLRDP